MNDTCHLIFSDFNEVLLIYHYSSPCNFLDAILKINNISLPMRLISILTIITSLTLTAKAQVVSNDALELLKSQGKQTNSGGLVVWVNGKSVVVEGAGLIDAMSATKSVVNLAVGILVTNGTIKSIDEPVHLYYPEWNQGLKKGITIRHLLNHTSGIQSQRLTNEIYEAPDFVQLALCAEVTSPPGVTFFYNNKATNLLAGIIEKASGRRMDKFLKVELFDFLGMKDYAWLTDSFLHHLNKTGKQDTAYLRSGNPIGMAELLITPAEFAKIGLFILNKGNAGDKQVISENWFDESFKAGQPYDPTCGLLWWLIYDPATSYITFGDEQIKKLEDIGLSEQLIMELKTIRGKYEKPYDLSLKFDSLPSIVKMGGRLKFRLMLFDKGYNDSPYTWHVTRVVGISAKGTYGQYLTIFPEKKIVAVRMIDSENYRSPEDDFAEFEYLVYKLVK